MTGSQFPDPINDTPAATKLVYITLDNADEPLTTNQIATRTSLSCRGVRKSLLRLKDRGVVEERPDTSDLRSTIYELKG